ncbi:MAG: Permease of the drug/metabolite transporter (DMT) superfamily [Burkholderiaceae bacterium]|jgi:drug/metabolite transporter (DMT)-like permease|nr:MAG: Permease of the drug/metabolite transporter (DMT) superfamily [Burkholderiaceae bacterium]
MGNASTVDFLLLSATWGASFLFLDLAALEFGPVATAALRVAIASLVLLPLLLRRGLGPQLLRLWKPLLIVGLLSYAIPFAMFSYAVLAIPTGLTAVLNATTPLFGALVAWVWLSEQLDLSRVTGLVIGFAGVALLAWQRIEPGVGDAASQGALLAIAACLVACLCYGFAASYTKRYLSGVAPLLTAGGSLLFSAIALAPLALLTWPAQMPGARAWGAVAAVGLLCTAFAYVRFFRLIERAGPARALTVTFVVPVFAIVYGMLFLGERVNGWMLLCALVIVCGTALSTGAVALRRHRHCPSPT